MFFNKEIVIATMHKKEQVIAPILSNKFGIKSFVLNDLNTDELGTFSGEIERKNDVLTTLRNKCLKALNNSNYKIAIASEGSFGAHPFIPFITADDEFLMLYDRENDLEIIAREISTETNFNGKFIKDINELLEFANSVDFPSHGLIVKSDDKNFEIIKKGIVNEQDLINSFNLSIKNYCKAFVETDMRALYNPLRMKVIEKVTLSLVDKMKSTCPKCLTPGFDIVEFIDGLPCELCGLPTKSIKTLVYCCKKCSYKEQKINKQNKVVESAGFCDFCNP